MKGLLILSMLLLAGCGNKVIRRYKYVTEDRITYVDVIVEVPVEVEIPYEVEVPVIIPTEAFSVTISDLTPFQYEPKKVLVKVKNETDITLNRFKLSPSQGSILFAYGSSSSYEGQGIISRGSLIAPGQELELVLQLSVVPTSALTLTVEAK